MEIKLDFSKSFTKKQILFFSQELKKIQSTIGFKVSSRGWCYLMEQAGFIDKSQFDKVDNAINRCRKEGLLPVDFVAEEASRAFDNVYIPSTETMPSLLARMLDDVLEGHWHFTPDWWKGEKYYIQILVEKIDLKTLFSPICADYKIPIANAKGWSSILQRAEYARRFKEAEDNGLKCVLLYCGDHDPDGLRISDTLRKNIKDLELINWQDGEIGYDPQDLIIERFGLNYEFIIEQGYSWIDNLVTGSGLDLGSPKHRNNGMPYVQKYLRDIGQRKCEANAIVTTPKEAKKLIKTEIEKWLGTDSLSRFKDKRNEVRTNYLKVLDDSNLEQPIREFLNR